MASVKEELKSMAEALPEDCTWEEVLYWLYVRERIERGLLSLDQGKGRPQKEVLREIREWLNASYGPLKPKKT